MKPIIIFLLGASYLLIGSTEWEVDREVDELTLEKRYSAIIRGKMLVRNTAGNSLPPSRDDDIFLRISCTSSGLVISVGFSGVAMAAILGGGDKVLRYRIDQSPIVEVRGSSQAAKNPEVQQRRFLTGSWEEMRLPNELSVLAARKLLNAREFVTEISTFAPAWLSRDPLFVGVHTFSPPADNTALKAVARACGRDLEQERA